MFEYEINGKKYIQKPLVWGQVRQFQSLLKEVVWPTEFTIVTFMEVFSDQLPQFAAIIVSEEGKLLKEKNIDGLTVEFEEFLDIGTSVKMVEDFFDCNPIDSILKSLSGMMRKVVEALPKKSVEIQSNISAVSLQEEILQNEIQ
jgi:hypothetical protein